MRPTNLILVKVEGRPVEERDNCIQFCTPTFKSGAVNVDAMMSRKINAEKVADDVKEIDVEVVEDEMILEEDDDEILIEDLAEDNIDCITMSDGTNLVVEYIGTKVYDFNTRECIAETNRETGEVTFLKEK